MFATQLDCQLVQVLMLLVVPSPYLSREHDGCSRLSLFLNMKSDMTQDCGQSYSVIVHDM